MQACDGLLHSKSVWVGWDLRVCMLTLPQLILVEVVQRSYIQKG